MYNKLIGIYVDAENVQDPALVVPLVRAASASGIINRLMLYGNWNSPILTDWNSPQFKKELENWPVFWSPLPTLRPGKNAADIAMTYHATVAAQSGAVNEIWIVSGDSDFTPLVEQLQLLRVRVVVCGPKNTPSRLKSACSSFILLDEILNACHFDGVNKPVPSQPLILNADKTGWLHGFVKFAGNRFGFIQVNPERALFFCAAKVDAPSAIEDLRKGDPVEFKLGRNHKGPMAVNVRKTFAFRTA